MLDDLHFADAASLELLPSLAEPAAGLRWALAYRPAEAGSALRALETALADAALQAPVPVGPLTPAALAELVDQLGLGLDGQAVAAALHQRTGGNPLFVLETLKQAWVENTLPGWPTRMPRPPSIERLIDRRIAQLSAPALALARVAAIAGVDFGIGLAEAVQQTPAVHLADALNELEAAQVLKGEQFAHDLVFDAVLRSVPAAIARHLHARVADWLVQHAGEPARIAQHYVEAGQSAAAIDWLGRAAARSERGLRLREAMGFLELRARLESEAGDAAAAFESALQAARISAGVDHERASGDERCDRLDQLAATPAQAVAARLWRAHLAELRDDPEGAEPALREALQRAVELGDASLIARCRLRLAAGLAIQDRLAEAAEHAESCRAWFDDNGSEHGSDDERGELHGVLAQIRDSDGRLEEARQHHTAAAACYERAGRHGKLADAHRDLASNYLFQGDSVHAREHLLLALRGYGQHDDDDAASGPALATLGACNTTLGRYAEALDDLARARALMAVHQPAGLVYLALYDASCWRHLGQWQRLHQALRPSTRWAIRRRRCAPPCCCSATTRPRPPAGTTPRCCARRWRCCPKARRRPCACWWRWSMRWTCRPPTGWRCSTPWPRRPRARATAASAWPRAYAPPRSPPKSTRHARGARRRPSSTRWRATPTPARTSSSPGWPPRVPSRPPGTPTRRAPRWRRAATGSPARGASRCRRSSAPASSSATRPMPPCSRWRARHGLASA